MITGRIIKGISGFYYVRDEHSRIFECKARGIFRKDDIKPLVGDYVKFEITDESKLTGNIVDILPRKNNLLRPPVSNIDQAIIVFAISNPLPSFLLVDKLLIYYDIQNIPITICFNKSDLVNNSNINEVKDIYKNAGVNLLFTAFKDNQGINDIKSLLKGQTTVITGPSGVGKSTLINTLVPEADMETGDISYKLHKGRNTTRHAELFELDNDTFILDTPGFTSFELEKVKAEDISSIYPEFKDYAEDCKFLDCIHIGETECGVKNAVKYGKINKVRYDNYKIIYEDILSKKNRR